MPSLRWCASRPFGDLTSDAHTVNGSPNQPVPLSRRMNSRRYIQLSSNPSSSPSAGFPPPARRNRGPLHRRMVSINVPPAPLRMTTISRTLYHAATTDSELFGTRMLAAGADNSRRRVRQNRARPENTGPGDATRQKPRRLRL